MRVIWTAEASRNMIELQDYIAAENPVAAFALAEKIRKSVAARLPNFPLSGREGRIAGTRELVVPGTPYIVPYRVRQNRIEILAVYHSSRKWPEGF